LIEATGLLLNERVEIYNINNGNRFTTYVIEGDAGSGVIGFNGAAARLACAGDKLIICAYAQMEESEARAWQPTVVVVGDDNKMEKPRT